MSENKSVQLGLCCLNTVLRSQTPFPVFASRKMIEENLIKPKTKIGLTILNLLEKLV